MLHDLIDKKLKSYYITCHKYMFLFSLLLSFIFCIFLLFNKSTNLSTIITTLLVAFAFIAFIFLITWTMNKKKYGKKLTIKDDEIIVYDYKNNKIQEFKVSDTKGAFIDVVFQEYPRYKHRKCMIVYIDFEPYDGMEYRSYWNMPNVVIIQNSKLITFFKNILIIQ